MPRQSDRFALDLSVELCVDELWERAIVQDVSRTGMFLAHAAHDVRLGTDVVVAFMHGGERVSARARVTHCLGAADARALCRSPGIGIAFEPHALAFTAAVDALLRRVRAPQLVHGHIVVADSEPRMLERLSTALGDAGFSVATASTGMELLGSAMRRTPDLVLVDRDTPIIDGLWLIEHLACDEQLSSVPVMMMAREARDLEAAFWRGAADVVLKPFSMLEVIARVRRVVQLPRRAEQVALAGSLAEIDLASILTMLEQQKKTGRIVVSNGHAAWIDIVEGRVVDAGWSLDGRHPRAVMMGLLEWTTGTFRMVASPERRREPGLALPIMHLLLESARLRDEAQRLPS